MPKLVANFILLCSSLLIGLLVAEITLRVLDMDAPVVWKPHPVLGWSHIPEVKTLYTDEGRGLIEINSHGFRDIERTYDKADGVFRIGVFGDSQTEAIQVNLEQTYPQILEKMLGERVEVFNFGVSGYSPAQEYLVMQDQIERYDIDLVLVSLYINNDVSGGLRKLRSQVQTGGAPYVVSTDGELQIDYSDAEDSVLSFEKQPAAAIRKLSGTYRFLTKLRRTLKSGPKKPAQGKSKISVYRQIYLSDVSSDWQDAWAVFEHTLLSMKRLADEKNVPVVYLSIPSGFVINDVAREEFFNRNPAIRDIGWDFEMPLERFQSISDKIGIKLIKVDDVFSKDPARANFYYNDFGHLAPDGHEKLAQLLEQALRPEIPE